MSTQGQETGERPPSVNSGTSSSSYQSPNEMLSREQREAGDKGEEQPSTNPQRGLAQLARDTETNISRIQKVLDNFENDLNSRLDRLSSTLSKVGEK